MKAGTLLSRVLAHSNRIDAWHHLSPGAIAYRKLDAAAKAGCQIVTVSQSPFDARVSAPGRFKRVYATRSEDSLKYLRPYDIFDYLPQTADLLSASKTTNRNALEIQRGMILQTCSGRNLGPAVMADDYLAQFVLSHDLVRVQIEDELMRFYTLAFIWTPTGQALLRRDKSGSVIDHITPQHVEGLSIPILDTENVAAVAQEAKAAFSKREQARHVLDSAMRHYSSIGAKPWKRPLKQGWGVNASALRGRIDAAPYAPEVRAIRDELLAIGGSRIGNVARVHKPAGRYKTYYVEPPYGTPILSGRQVLQATAIHLKRISHRSFQRPEEYELAADWICFPADGRADERLGFPAVVTGDRSGWMASGHVARLIPYDSQDTGWLWAAMASPAVQRQLASLACGSVVDALYEWDIANVILPPPQVEILPADILCAWRLFADARACEQAAVERFERELTKLITH